MSLIRCLLVVMVVLSTSLLGAMDARHAATAEHDHAAMNHMVEDQPNCCIETTEHTQSCHAVFALLPSAGLNEPTSAACENVIMGPGLRLTGIMPSGPLDPPRRV